MTAPDAAFEALLEFLKQTRGIDFTGYKRTSLQRRFQRRMETVECTSFSDYLDYLEVNPEEYELLFETLLINVTEFFRDLASWEHLRDEVLPRLLMDIPQDEPIRAWSAGCAGGHEAYTLAMVLAEALGNEAFTRRVKIYATDVDEDALSRARQATYSAKDVENLPQRLLETYFERSGDGYVFLRELRRSVIFGRHNLLTDAPISKVDLLCCRNTLMYFHSEAQQRILANLHFALADNGTLPR